MNFRKGRAREEPEINLIPMIDVLLVILIFLMITTTYSRYSGLKVTLPQALPGAAPSPANDAIRVEVRVDGTVLVEGQPVSGGVEAVGRALQAAAAGRAEPPVTISADTLASHGSVVSVLESAQWAGYHHVTVLTRLTPH
jgi:biopolymer transport protein ExbD